MSEYKSIKKSILIQKKGYDSKSIIQNKTGIPPQIKTTFEKKSGFSFDDVRVHYNSPKPEAIQALAYTKGNNVYMGPGQENHLKHELGHVVQQKQGIVTPTGSINGEKLNDDISMERGADQWGNI